jgi:uncharacterized membrane protein YfcA
MSFLMDFILGFVLGLIGGMFGIGGGLLAIPVLGWIFSLDQQVAQGTALVMTVPNVIVGFLRYRYHNPIDLKSASILGLSTIVSSFLAATLASHLSSHSMRILFAFFLIGVSSFLIFELRHATPLLPLRQFSQKWLALVGMMSGLFSGLFTVGGGLVVAPILIKFFGITKQTIAQGFSLATVMPGAFIALLTYSLSHQVNWSIGIPLSMGGILSISIGVDLAHRLPERLLRMLFCGLIIIIALILLL